MNTRRSLDDALEPTADPSWRLTEVGYDPLRESSRQSRFALSNGFLGIRSERAFTRGERWVAPSRTYVAGLFDTPCAEGAVPMLMPAADWLQVRVLLAGGPLVHEPGEVPSHRMTLDMRRGLLLTDCRHANTLVSLRVRELRLVSLSDRSIGLQRIRLEIEEGSVEVTLEASLDGAAPALVPERLKQNRGLWRTRRSGRPLAMAWATTLSVDDAIRQPTALGEGQSSWTWTTRPGQVVEFERVVAVARGEHDDGDVVGYADDHLAVATRIGWRGVVSEHEAAWAERWACSDIEIDGDPAAQQALRFAVYHLNGAANPDDERVSIAARALTGPDYAGHVFWDTEIFLLPFYCLTWPEAARALLMYRFHTLDAARAKAKRLGWRGALYAWESADTGDEATPDHVVGPDRQVLDILCGTQEQHISADVAYAVWQYWTATGDEAFLRSAGAEILLETARFWSSRAVAEADGKRHIRGVIGPDEYHETIDDNAFTNVMARCNIERGLEVADLFRERWPERWTELSGRLDLTDTELDQWREVVETIATGLDADTGLFEQFEGYAALEDIDLTHYAGRSVPMDVVLGRERTRRSQVIKQADVVALLALLPEAFAGDTADLNFRHYEPRCGHGSSLSTTMHGLVAARLGETEKALDYFHRTAAIDLGDTKVAIAGGIHIAALGGLWLIAVFGFAGVCLSSESIRLAPNLPANWTRLSFRVQWRGRRIKVVIDQSHTTLEAILESGDPLTIVVGGGHHVVDRNDAGQGRIAVTLPLIGGSG